MVDEVEDDDGDDLAAFGIRIEIEEDEDQEEEEQGREDPDDERFEVWPENWETVMVFKACGTQWIMGSVGMGGLYYQGLDYTRVRDVMDIRKVRDQKAMLEDLQLMELEAKVELNRKLAEKRS